MCCQIEESCFLNLQVFFSICSSFLFWLCCEHLQRMLCQIEEVVFLICRCFFYLQRVELSWPPYNHDYFGQYCKQDTRATNIS